MDAGSSSPMYRSDAVFSSQDVTSDAFPSSPPPMPSRSNKPKRAPTITPRRFTRFFTPSSGRQPDSSPSVSAKALRRLTGSAVNRRDNASIEFEDFADARPTKRRKHIGIENRASCSTRFDYDSDALIGTSSPIRSSPYPQATSRSQYLQGVRDVCEWEPSPYRRARLPKVVEDYRYTTAGFCSTSKDVHSYIDTEPHTVAYCVAACHTNSLAALGNEDGSIRIVETAQGATPEFNTPLLSFKPHENTIFSAAFSSDDRWLATACGDATAKVVDMYTQKTVFVLNGQILSLKQVVFQPGEDNVLATCSRDGEVALWDLRCNRRGPAFSLGVGQWRDKHAERVGKRQEIDEQATDKKEIDDQETDDHAVKLVKTNSIVRGHCPDLLCAPTHSSATEAAAITSLQFLSEPRSNLLLTSSTASARLRLWDIRARYTNGRGSPIPLSVTSAPPSHEYTMRQTHHGDALAYNPRPKGVSSLALNTDSTRVYAVCTDNTVYAYSTNHLILGQAPELTANAPKAWTQRTERNTMGPLYGLRHPDLSTRGFYVRCAVRKRTSEHDEVLAVGSYTGTPVLFSTDESGYRDDETSESATAMANDMLPIYEHGTPLIRGHQAEVTGLTWTSNGDLVSVSDDRTARVWREDTNMARELRMGGEVEGKRWNCGWANVPNEWDGDDG